MASRSISDLVPELRAKAQEWLALCEREWPGREVDPLITCTLRSMEEQARLYAQGRTAPGPVVTWAKPGQSAHNVGAAFDFVPVRNGRPVWGTRSPEDMALWQRMGALAESLGLEWGGRWATKRDLPHVQLKGWKSYAPR